MKQERIDILTSVGRLVSGDVFKANTTDAQGRPLVIKSGPNAGQPKSEYYFGLAIPKTDPTFNTEIWAKLQQAAKIGFPTLFDAAGNCTRPDFAWKIVDGDSQVPNQNNTVPATKEGYSGHWVLSFKGGFAPKVYSKSGETLLTDPESVKKGYYIRVYGSVTANGDMQKPGVYLNPVMVELVGYGEEITSGPDGGAVFGGAPVTNLPAGASATPLAGTPIAGPGGMPGAQPGAGTPMGQMTNPMQQNTGTPPAGAGMPGANPMQGVQPAHDFLNPQGANPMQQGAGAMPGQQMGAQPGGPTPPTGPKMYNVQGQQYTYEQLLGFNWTPEQIAGLGQ